MLFAKRKTVPALMASLMVVFLLAGSASADLPSEEHSVGFKGTIFSASWVDYSDTDTFQLQEFQLLVADGALRDVGAKGRCEPGQIVKFHGFYQVAECEWWNLAGAVRFDADAGFPFDTDTRAVNVELPVVADHQVLRVVTGGCAWDDPETHKHFSGTVNVVLDAVEECPKKGPKGRCNRSNSLSGSFTVVLDTSEPTPFDEEWNDNFRSWRGDNSYNGTYWWNEPIIPPPTT